ncbi:hypothetical protein [Metabacillus halosaccharovorans]|uniref:hypothetical protein n=1 Tax=Metabacillus halosaccharovorans TaxID=930124 RepID=UPI00203C0935|nr:hypothetical protein [Metabacillus halosaccharovorans]MCM3444242.1 hypothetical protein [Metabacillus halosaccharovorans]
MRTANIIDFFTQKSYAELSAKDFKKNDELTEKYGGYLGCLKKSDSDKLRAMRAELDFRCEQINRLTYEWERLSAEHQELLDYCLNYLYSFSSKINKEENEIMISVDRHVWFFENQTK